MPEITVTNIDILTNDCLLTDPLELNIDFTCNETIKGAVWEVKYLVDYTGKRHLIEIDTTEGVDYEEGENSFGFKCDALAVEGVKRSTLKNMGLFLLTMKQGDEEVIQISLVTQVTKKDGELYRLMFNPLE
eukprot:TRINITY_DN32011_c0_g1_i1.p1 TRINITY_DN32011_c0_g1~~TRINITY_DN32011_c0_g1_i1.p1  ORF type:complete len:131 (+),score=42.87 TRINITY_DN32011_c0_g1_i1:45-437(+)